MHIVYIYTSRKKNDTGLGKIIKNKAGTSAGNFPGDGSSLSCSEDYLHGVLSVVGSVELGALHKAYPLLYINLPE